MTRILVMGGSQGIGLAVCRAAIARGHRVRAMSRNGRLPADIGSHCEAFIGDARNADDVTRALADMDVVVQALGVPPGQKYQSNGGPGIADILRLLQAANEPLADQAAFLKCQILFWLIGATDGHGKNFSLFLRPQGRFVLTPIYDVLSAQPAFDLGQIPLKHYKLAMSAGTSRHYRLDQIVGRHFVQTGKAAGLGPTVTRRAIEEILERAPKAPGTALAAMPADFADGVHVSIAAAIERRLPHLASALEEL